MPVRKWSLTFGRASFFVSQRIGIYVGWVDVKDFLIMPALRKSTHHSKEFFGGLAIVGCPYSKWFMTPTHPATTTYASAYLGHPLSLRGLSPSPRLLFCVPQRIGIYAGWVDVKGFLIMSALRKSTHHSKESTGKQIKSICLSFWWVGYCRMSIG